MFNLFTKDIKIGEIRKRVIDWNAVVSTAIFVLILLTVLSKCSE